MSRIILLYAWQKSILYRLSSEENDMKTLKKLYDKIVMFIIIKWFPHRVKPTYAEKGIQVRNLWER